MSELQGKRILYIFGHNGTDEWMLKLSREFERKWQAHSYFFGGVKNGERFFMEQNIPLSNIYLSHIDFSIKNLPPPDREYIKRAEELYNFNCWDIWQISAPRSKKRQKFSEDKILYWMEFYIKAVEEVFAKFKPDYVVFGGIGSFAGVILYRMMEYYKIIPLEIVNGRVPNRFTINNNLTNTWPLLLQRYQETKTKRLTAAQQEIAGQFIQNFREKPFKPDDALKVKVPFSRKVEKYKSYLKTLYFRKELPDLRQYLYPFTDRLLDMSGLFEMPMPGEKYAYFPLHITPEVTTSWYGKWHVNQLMLIESISRSLPCDCKLYVKEHVMNYSSRERNFHQTIKKFPNVRLITPHTSSIELIKNSVLVLTITGTVGWEAIMLQKPVITFGDVYYNIFEEVTNITCIKDLPPAIKSKLGKTTDRGKTLQFVHALLNSTFVGNGALPGDCARKSLDDENISLLVKGIEEYVTILNKS